MVGIDIVLIVRAVVVLTSPIVTFSCLESRSTFQEMNLAVHAIQRHNNGIAMSHGDLTRLESTEQRSPRSRSDRLDV